MLNASPERARCGKFQAMAHNLENTIRKQNFREVMNSVGIFVRQYLILWRIFFPERPASYSITGVSSSSDNRE